MTRIHKFPDKTPEMAYDDIPFPKFTSTTTWGTISDNYFGGNCYHLFASDGYWLAGGWNADHTVQFTWVAPETVRMYAFQHDGNTQSNYAYSASSVDIFGWDYNTSAWVHLGGRWYGESYYGGWNYNNITPMISNKFRIDVRFKSRANMPGTSRLHYVIPYVQRITEVTEFGDTDPKCMFYKEGSIYYGLLKQRGE